MKHAVAGLLVLVGLINFFPVVGVLGAERLASLYGVPIQDPNLVILMRHRALLLGFAGAFIAWAAFRPPLQPAAFLVGAFSMLTFVGIAVTSDGYNPALRRVVLADLVTSAALFAAAGLYWLGRRPASDPQLNREEQ